MSVSISVTARSPPQLEGPSPAHIAQLMRASQEGRAEELRELLASSMYVDVCNADGSTPLLEACRHGHVSCVRLLVECGANVERRNKANVTALHFACHAGSAGCVSQLIDAGADVDAMDDEGTTPVVMACVHGHPGCLRLLLDAGADATRTFLDVTPLEWAQRTGHRECVTVLRAHLPRTTGNIFEEDPSFLREAGGHQGEFLHLLQRCCPRAALPVGVGGLTLICLGPPLWCLGVYIAKDGMHTLCYTPVPHFMVVNGSVASAVQLIHMVIMWLTARTRERQSAEDEKSVTTTACLKCIVFPPSLFLCIWWIMGNVWVWGSDPCEVTGFVNYAWWAGREASLYPDPPPPPPPWPPSEPLAPSPPPSLPLPLAPSPWSAGEAVAAIAARNVPAGNCCDIWVGAVSYLIYSYCFLGVSFCLTIFSLCISPSLLQERTRNAVYSHFTDDSSAGHSSCCRSKADASESRVAESESRWMPEETRWVSRGNGLSEVPEDSEFETSRGTPAPRPASAAPSSAGDAEPLCGSRQTVGAGADLHVEVGGAEQAPARDTKARRLSSSGKEKRVSIRV